MTDTFFADQNILNAFCCKAVSETLDAKAKTTQSQRLRILLVGQSAQQIYSIAMALCDWIPDHDFYDIQIVATDTSDQRLRAASLGRFDTDELNGLDPSVVEKYFVRDGADWRVHDRVRMLLFFRQWDMLSSLDRVFDICFCPRIDDAAARQRAYDGIVNHLASQGYLFSDDEALAELGERFQPYHHCGAVLYHPQGAPCPADAGV